MDDFGDYIYLIAIVIAGLSSLLKKKKPAQRDLQEDTMPDLDDVIPDIEEEEYIPQREPVQRQEPVYRNERYKTEEQYTPRHTTPLPQPEYTQSKQAEKVQVKYESVADFVKLKAQRTTKPVHHLVKTQETLEVAVEPEFHVEFETAEDVKRAFVYSEIFNRKY